MPVGVGDKTQPPDIGSAWACARARSAGDKGLESEARKAGVDPIVAKLAGLSASHPKSSSVAAAARAAEPNVIM